MSDRVIVLSHRPSRVVAEHDLSAFRALSPMERRNSENFRTVFNEIWKELENDAG
jgi:ABC-type nitrate/sulfonate/bicarbonate transport system ATPase subunit